MRLAPLVLAGAMLGLRPTTGQTQAKPYVLADITTFLESGLTSARIATRLETNCFAGDLGVSQLATIQRLGATPALLQALRVRACPRGAANGVEMLRNKVSAPMRADVVASVDEQELSVTRLANILGTSQAPVEKDVARSIAELWVNYQLVALSGANGDSLADKRTMDQALWSKIDNIRVKKFYADVSKGWDVRSAGPDRQRYMNGEAMAARHILVKVEANATPEQKMAALKKAQSIRAEATPANFARLAAKSDEPGAAKRGGDLGVFEKGKMVPEFERCLLAIKPGEISPACATSFGYHVIYRSPYADVAEKFAPIAKQRNVQIAESTYLAKVEMSNAVQLTSGAAVNAKAIARNPLGYRNDNGKLATYRNGELTASEFADWIAAYPPNLQIRPQLLNAPDTLVEKFVRQIVRNELIRYQADSAQSVLDTAEISNLYLKFRNAVTQTWRSLNVEPSKLVDRVQPGGNKAKIAAARIEAFFDRLKNSEVEFVDVPYPLARALQTKYDFRINDAGLDAVVEKARVVRSSAGARRSPTTGAVDSNDLENACSADNDDVREHNQPAVVCPRNE